MAHRVAVIGAGPSGLSSIKICLEEGLQPTFFESSHDIGGLWRYKEEPEPGRANVYQSVIINSSKEMMAFSDFPPSAELPNNMHHSDVLGYLRLYANHFNLLPHIQLKTTVQQVTQTPDFALTGQWEVDDFLGIENFEGRCFHSWEYHNADGMQGKRVVVIGIGSSGGGTLLWISVELRKRCISVPGVVRG
uniref:Flavin-containing monooxygenase n=1 Tax=Knipowitschia caucasica TaxID=637954 RepID=A0AAV2KZX0_KNICA